MKGWYEGVVWMRILFKRVEFREGKGIVERRGGVEIIISIT
jgi:hypothetical protein